MPFIGTTPTQGFVSSFPKQSFTPNGSTTVFTLTNPVATANDLEVFVGNVRQEPTTAYTAAGTTLTMSEAPASGLNFYVINKSFAQVTTNPPDGSVSAAKMATGAAQANISAGTITASQLNLADNYTFTGTIKTSNGMDLLATRNDSSAVNYASDVNIIDLTSYQSSYDTFFVDLTFHHTASTGSSHLYLKGENNSGTNLNLRFISHGYSQDASQAIPQNGTGSYFRPTFAVQAGTTATHKFYIHNSRDSDTALSAHLAGNSYWYREGSGATAANFAAYVDNGDKFGYIDLNLDQVSSGGGETGKVYMRLYGVK